MTPYDSMRAAAEKNRVRSREFLVAGGAFIF